MTTSTPNPETPAAEPAPAEKPPASKLLAKVRTSATGRQRMGGEDYLFSIRDEVAELLTGSPFDVDSYLQNAYRVIAAVPQLVQACRDAGPTILGGVMLGATLQLPIGGPLGQFYLTPRNEGRGPDARKVCVPMIGYRGFFELGYRSGRIRNFDYIIVRDGDTFTKGGSSERGKFFDWQQFADGEFDDQNEDGEKRPLRGVIALASPIVGDPAWQYMSKATIEHRRPSYWQGTPWSGKDSEAMYVKTPHRELAKFLQLSIQSATAVAADEQIAQWNRATGAIETLDSTRDQHYDEGADGAPAETGQNPGQQDDQQPEPEPVPVAASQSPEPARGRTAARDNRPDSVERHPDDPDYEPWLTRIAGPPES